MMHVGFTAIPGFESLNCSRKGCDVTRFLDESEKRRSKARLMAEHSLCVADGACLWR